MTHQTVTAAPEVPTLTTVDEATALLAKLAEAHDWVSVFWDRGWGDSPLEISVIVGGNGQDPKAYITDDVYRALRASDVIPRNTLKTYKARRLHDYRTPPEPEPTGPTPNDIAEQVIRAIFTDHPDWPMHAEFYRGIDPDSDIPRTMHEHLYSTVYGKSRGGIWHMLLLPGCRDIPISIQRPSILGPSLHGEVTIVSYPRTADGDVDLDALAGSEFRARLVDAIDELRAEIDRARTEGNPF